MGYDVFDRLCKSRGITAYQVAKDTGVSTSTLSSWKIGRYVPKSDKLKRIADYFGVPVDNFYQDDNQDSINSYDIFEQLLKEKNITAYRISKDTGIAQSVLSAWKTGKSTPKLDKLKAIADYLGVSIEYLMGEEKKEEKQPGYYTNPETARLAQEAFDDPDMKALFHMKRNMDPETFKAHLDMMKRMYQLEHPEDDDDFTGC